MSLLDSCAKISAILKQMRFRVNECETLINTHYTSHGHKLLLSHETQIFCVPTTEIKGQFVPVKSK